MNCTPAISHFSFPLKHKEVWLIMINVNEHINDSPLVTTGDYFRAYRKLKDTVKEEDFTSSLRIALLSSFTTKGLDEVLFAQLCRAGIWPEIYSAEYNQYAQEILNPASALYAFQPDVVILFVDTQTILADGYFLPYRMDENGRLAELLERKKDITSYIDILRERTSAFIMPHNFAVPTYSPYGILEQKQAHGFFERIEEINRHLRDGFKKDERVFVFDYDGFCSRIGKEKIIHDTMYYMGDFRLDTAYYPELAREYLRYILPLRAAPKKCIALDLDDTIWGGVVGEDGLEGIQLGPTREGRPFWEFQKHLLALYERGVILAVNSKNNYDEALRAIREHPHMVLREQHFAAMKMNWQDKATNLRELSVELNIGLDSFVFVDNDSMNRDLVRAILPEVTVVDLPTDPSGYVRAIRRLSEFESHRMTAEDIKRGQMYAEERQRNELKSSAGDIKDYLRGLNLKLRIERATDFTIPRIAQLCERTNQWNMTIRRYTESDIRDMLAQGAYVVSFSASDRFGDNGTVGVAVMKNASEIDSFLMSCRVIGRGIEQAILWHLIENAKTAGVAVLRAEFIPTKKNVVAKDFYKNNGFALVEETAEKQVWKYNVSREYPRPEHIETEIA